MSVRWDKKGPFWKRKLYQRLSILSWLKDYNTDSAISDLIAGITVGLTVMPQSLAYASLAGLQPQVSTLCTTSEKYSTVKPRYKSHTLPRDKGGIHK